MVNPVGIVAGLIGTAGMLAAAYYVFHDEYNVDYGPEGRPEDDWGYEDVFFAIGCLIIWWSFPGAWFRGMVFDPACTVIAVTVIAASKVSGIFKVDTQDHK